MKWSTQLETIIGSLIVSEDEIGICEISFAAKDRLKPEDRKETPLLKRACLELSEYLDGKRSIFDLPLSLKGTVFQESVWCALKTIPYGETRTYSDIAKQIGKPKACRAVGMANHNNPIAIMIPCHRVVGSNGTLTGYAGGLNIKERLLELERYGMD